MIVEDEDDHMQRWNHKISSLHYSSLSMSIKSIYVKILIKIKVFLKKFKLNNGRSFK